MYVYAEDILNSVKYYKFKLDNEASRGAGV